MTGSAESALAVAVLDALLRENYAGLSSAVHDKAGPEGTVLVLPSGMRLPLRPDGFLARWRIDADVAPALTLDDVDRLVAAISDPADAAGVAAFRAECRAALLGLRLRETRRPAGTGQSRAQPLGAAGLLGYDAVAAVLPHPAYPTAAARPGLSAAELLKYAPEFRPTFQLAWAAVPRSSLTAGPARGDSWRTNHRPSRLVAHESREWWPGRREWWPGRREWWPEMAAVGLAAGLADTHELLPVHPLTVPYLPDGATLAPDRRLTVRPTLSMRTVAVMDDPSVHIKVPLPVSTLGLRNRRSIRPDTLPDGALMYGLLARILADDPELGRSLVLADDSTWVHAGHEYLGCLVRRLPDTLAGCRVVPVAALLAPGVRVLDEVGFVVYLGVVFSVAVRLFVRYGIALESHQQNTAVVVRPGEPVQLLVKDFDGSLVSPARLGRGCPAFADPRLLTESDDALADVFITITLHLCAGAIAFGLAERAVAPLPRLLRAVRSALVTVLDRYRGDPAADRLRARVLDTDTLPGKAMLTAGTLRDKARTGARDINKFYGTSGPNYLTGVTA